MNNTAQPATEATAHWQQLYQQLEAFYQCSHDQATAQQLTDQAEQLAKQLIACAEQSELALFTQLQCSPDDIRFTTSIAIKQACLVLVIARRLCWPAVLLQQLISSVWLSYIAVSPVLDAQQPEQRNASMLLRYPARYTLARLKTRLPLYARQWFQHAYDGESQQRHWRRNPFSDLLSLSGQLCWLMVKAPADGLATAMQISYWRCHCPQERYYLEQWAATGPALWQCGSWVNDQQGKHWLLLEQPSELLLVLPIGPQGLQLPIRSLSQTEPPFERQPNTSLPHWHWLQTIAQAEHSDLIQARLPESGQQFLAPSLIKQFCQQSLPQQLSLLEQDSSSRAILLKAASQQSREQLPVQDTKHALLLLGSAQLPWLLAQAQCQRFCQHQAQPHHGLLQQLQQILCVALQLQAVALPQAQLQLLAWLLVLPLWQLSALRLLPQYSIAAMQAFYKACSRHIWQSEHYTKRLQLLMQSYALHPSLNQAIVHFRMPQSADAQSDEVKQLSQQLHQAWRLSLAVLFNASGSAVMQTEQVQALLAQHAVHYPMTTL